MPISPTPQGGQAVQTDAVERIRKALSDREIYGKAMVRGDSIQALRIEEEYGAAGYPPELASLFIAPEFSDWHALLTAHDSATAALRAKEEECAKLRAALQQASELLHGDAYKAARAVIGATDARKDK
jgi:hypothetical protein